VCIIVGPSDEVEPAVAEGEGDEVGDEVGEVVEEALADGEGEDEGGGPEAGVPGDPGEEASAGLAASPFWWLWCE